MADERKPRRLRRGDLTASVLAIGLAAVLTGCPDPEGKFDEFAEKLAAKPKPPAGECGAAVTQDVEGVFFAALATQLARQHPAVLLVHATTDGAGLHLVLQPLRVDDRKTPVGDPITADPAPIDESGHFSATLRDVVLDGAANPITADPIVAPALVLDGTACDAFLCGDLSGKLEKPLPLTLLAGQSQFAMQRLADGESYPEPPTIDCAGDLADPLP